MKPFWVTFYSYKGGVGRSLALANIAALLVKRGRRVLLIDFDLEAPGLASFAELSAAAGRPGVVEYVADFLRREAASDIRDYVHPCDLPGPLRGKLWVMPAGKCDDVYNDHLSQISWSKLYESGLGAPFFANWQAAIESHFRPDYVFVDSRTGLTEIGGVCTTQFPDLVMMLFALNEQNVNGVATVAQSIREADPDRVPQIHFVATPVPNLPPVIDKQIPNRRSQLVERLESAAERLGVKISSTIHYYAPASLSEKMFVLEDGFTKQRISNDYEQLCEKIVEFNRTGLDFLMEQGATLIAEGDSTRMERLETVLQRDYSDRAEAIYLRARFAVARNQMSQAIELAQRAFQEDPIYEDVFNFLCGYYIRLRQPERVLELTDHIMERKEALPPERRYKVRETRGEAFMALGQYPDAGICFSECMEYAPKDSADPEAMLTLAFNLAESTRRGHNVIEPNIWKQVVAFFGKVGTSSDAPLPIQAYRWQAMHVAYACGGDLDAAREALRKAQRAAEAAGEIEDIFSIAVYLPVPVFEFIEINKAMIEALERWELWDGMNLSAVGG
ncbi:MAG: AAA family ATPase [Chthoniobacter sp.]|nr:AAA family ATPase [Chthoniobacter sp.]